MRWLKVEAEFDGFGARRNIMRAAEGRKKIIECGLVGQVDDREAKAPFVAIALEEIVVTDGKVEKIPWRDARWIVIIVLRAGRGDLHQVRPVQVSRAHGEWRGQGWKQIPAEQTSLNLLITGETS